MRNIEFHKDEINEIIKEKGELCVFVGETIGKAFTEFGEKYCGNYPGNPLNFIDWLLEEHKYPIKLTDEEKAFLNVLNCEYFIARDKNKVLYMYEEKPIRNESSNLWYTSNYEDNYVSLKESYFPFITWESEPYSTKELLNLEVDENDE